MATPNILPRPAAPGATRRGLLARLNRSSRWYWVRLLVENPVSLASSIFLLLLMLLAIAAPQVAPYEPKAIDPMQRLQEPSDRHWFGTDELGRDTFSRLLFGTRVSLVVGASVSVLAALAGSVLGLVAAYYRFLDTIIMRILDGFMAFPGILLAIAIMASLGSRTSNVVIALALVTTPHIARLMRGIALVLREELYVESARAIGLPDWRILIRYVLPNAFSLLIVQCTFTIALAIIAEASLSFLGAGVPAETPTWGNMLRDGQRLINQAWWLSVFPGTALFLTVLAFNLLGDALRDALDPRSPTRRV